MKRSVTHWKLMVVLGLCIATACIWYAIIRESPTTTMTIAFLNVGQGDAIYIESPTRNRILVDGGPPRAVMGELSKVLPFYTRTIDTLIVTNPDADHYAGFIDVLRYYTVGRVIEPGTRSDTETYKEFERTVDAERAQELVGRQGTVLDLGGGASLTILFPNRDVSMTDRNTGSIIAKLTYGSTSVMLTGDAPSATEEEVLRQYGTSSIKSTVLKVGHHGSRTSASEAFIAAVDPEYSIISAGANNRYNHPHQETTDLLKKLGIPVFGTYEKGTIVVKTDGRTLSVTTEK